MALAEGGLKEKGPTDPRLLPGCAGASRPATSHTEILVRVLSLR